MRSPLSAFRMTLCLFAALLTACAVGPRYATPRIDAAAQWMTDANAAPIELNWWRSFNDPLLDELVQSAVSSNPDLKEAQARLWEARADRAAAMGQQLPQLNVDGAVNRNAFSEDGPIPVQRIPGFQRDYNLFEASFDASWEIDLWGYHRRAVEAARDRVQSADENRRDVLMRIVTEVARSYIDLRSAQQRLASAQADADAQADEARLIGQRWQLGEASHFDFLRADAQARTARALLPDLDAAAHEAVFRLGVLTGRPPEVLASRLLQPSPMPTMPSPVAVGLRSEVLRRRPDVRQAERELAAATADVGVATADLFPRLSLVGSIGQESLTAHNFYQAESTTFAVGPSLHWPVFAGGTLRAKLKAAGARADAATAAYDAAVIGALSDSETALNRFAASQRAREERDLALQQTAAALTLARQRYHAGEDDLVVLLDAQSAYSVSEQQSIAADAAALSALVSVYKALGGGWQSFEPTVADDRG